MTTTLQILKRHMSGGAGHEHFAEVAWRNIDTGATGNSTRSAMVAWLDKLTTNTAFVEDAKGNRAFVGTRHPEGRPAYIQTYADRTWNDNLLALPTY